jgi:phosphatidylglycerophosphatase A
MNFRDRAVVCLATGFYVGNVPLAPGTLGSILGLPLCFAISYLHLSLAILFAVLFVVIAILISTAAEKILEKKDPGSIVIDEAAGMLVTLLGLPFNLKTVVLGFILFRILDILKPFPIRFLEKKISGGTGVVVDDLIAGICANFLLRLLSDFSLFRIGHG